MNTPRALAVFAAAGLIACADGQIPIEPELNAPTDVSRDVIVQPPPTTDMDVVALVPGCDGQDCSQVTIGQTQLVGWWVFGGAAAVEGINGRGNISLLVPGSDTIPGPPAPRHSFRAPGSDAATQYAEILTMAGVPSDTIPGPPAPSPFVQTFGEDALFLLWVDDLIAKQVLPRDGGDAFNLEIIWTEGTRRTGYTVHSAEGLFPPSDTIPPPPVGAN